MMRKFLGIFRAGNAQSPETRALTYEQLVAEHEHRYPPFPKGIAAIPPDTVINGQEELIRQIISSRGLSGGHNKQLAELQILKPIRHFAELVHLLPASEKGHFRTPGGLFRFGLESALFSIRQAERRILTRETPELRKDTEYLWTHAAFLAGLFSESINTLSKLAVYSESGLAWHPGVEPLYQWLLKHTIKNYHIRWAEQTDRAMAVTVAGKTILNEQAQLLATGEKAILSTLMSALYNLDDLSNPIVKINQSVRYNLIERDLATDASRYGKPKAGMHLEPWLIDAMRHLLLNQKWQLNTDSGRVWFGTDGVYLVWEIAGNDLRKELKNAKSPFVPYTTAIMAEILLDAKIIELNTRSGNYLFDICVPSSEAQNTILTAVRLMRPEILFGNTDYEALNTVLEVNHNNIVEDVIIDFAANSPSDISCMQETEITAQSTIEPAISASVSDPQHQDLLAQLLSSQQRKPKNNQPGTEDLKLKKNSVLESLNKISPDYKKYHGNGITKIYVEGLKAVNLKADLCVAVLKASGLLISVEGRDFGFEETENKTLRFFLINEEVLNG